VSKLRDENGFGIGTFAISILTVIVAFGALIVAGQALTTSKDAEDAAALGGTGASVSLAEFSIDPSSVEVPAGGSLVVRNTGAVVHNLEIVGTDVKTSDIDPGGAESLDLSSLKPGTYEMFCAVSGHKGAGMVGSITVGSAGHAGHGESAAGGTNTPANDSMDAIQKKVVDQYVAQLEDGPNTEGVGAQPMEPTVLADGTKEFTLTAEITDWEVEPGKVVQAWTYNGTVPGPTIKVQPGDKVRVVLDNQLPQSTAIHWHGIDVPNGMDGVPFITQDPVKPGEEFAYEFVANGPAVGMYHSHHHAEAQVPDGLLGAFLVGDEPRPAGVNVSQEIPMVLNDAGVIGLSLNGKSFPGTAPTIAKVGDWVLIHYMNEGLQVHPMHLHGLPQLVIAKDGFPVPQPYSADTISVAPGERYSVLVQATIPGVWAWHCHILNHAEREDGMFGMVTAFIVQ
jgi:plastocyanin